MKRIAMGLGAVVLAVAIAGALWWFRPWSEYSPSEVYASSIAEDRVPFYRAMDGIYPARAFAGAAAPIALPTAPRGIDPGAVSVNGQPLDLEAFAEARHLTGLLVVSNGEVVLERYFNGETAGDRHTSWSVAKSVVATLIGIALDDAQIGSIDDPVREYAEEYAGTSYGDVSIRHLLMMSSGIDFEEDYEVDGSDIRKLFFGTFFWNRDVDSIVREHEAGHEAGTRFDYISANTAVLAAVLRGAYDRPLTAIAQTELFAPLGIASGTWLTDSQAAEAKALAYCCMQLRLRDFAKLGLLFTRDGMTPDGRIVSADWIDFLTTPPQPSHEPGPTGSGRSGYGHHVWIAPGGDVPFMRGFNGQIVWMDRERDVVIAVTSADPGFAGFFAQWPPILRALGDATVALRTES